MAKAFVSTGDMTEKTVTFGEIGRDLYALTTERASKTRRRNNRILVTKG